MKQIFSFVLAACLLTAAIPAMASGDTKAGTPARSSVSGKVVDQLSGETLAGVRVTVKGTGYTAYTGFDGMFTIAGIAPGEYSLVLTLISYQPCIIGNVRIDAAGQAEVEAKLTAQ